MHKIFPSVSHWTVYGTDATPFGRMVKLITQVNRQAPTETDCRKFMMQQTVFDIRIICHPRMGQTSLDFKIPVASGEGYITVNTYRDMWKRLTIAGENQCTGSQCRILRLINQRLDAGRNIKDIQAYVSIQLVKISRSFLRILRSSGYLYPEIIIPPSFVVLGLLVDACRQVSAIRAGTHIAGHIAL